MILIHDMFIAVMTPPKCASNTIHAVLRAMPWNGETFSGPNSSGPETMDKHMNFWPHESLRYKKVVSIRNPYNRMVSLYLHYCSRKSGRGLPSPSFKEYSEWVSTGSPVVENWYSWNLSRWLEEVDFEHVIRTEFIQEDLKTLGISVASIPLLNRNYRAQRYIDFFTPEIMEIVHPWCEPDCIQFNYPQEVHIHGTWN